MSTSNRSPSPALLAGVDDYVRGHGTEDEAERFEEEMFARALEGEAHDVVDYERLIGALRDVAERGTLENFMVKADVEKLRARYGERLVFRELHGGTDWQRVQVPRSAELCLTKVPMNLEGAERVDIEIEIEGAGVIKTMPDVAFEAAENAIYGCCEADLARFTVGLSIISRYWAHSRDGKRLACETRVVSELGP